jgi:hypothetical protein
LFEQEGNVRETIDKTSIRSLSQISLCLVSAVLIASLAGCKSNSGNEAKTVDINGA